VVFEKDQWKCKGGKWLKKIAFFSLVLDGSLEAESLLFPCMWNFFRILHFTLKF
jgi:hypothetical protein